MGDLVMLSKRRPTAPLQLPSWVTSVETPLVVSDCYSNTPTRCTGGTCWTVSNTGSVLASDMGAISASQPR